MFVFVAPVAVIGAGAFCLLAWSDWKRQEIPLSIVLVIGVAGLLWSAGQGSGVLKTCAGVLVGAIFFGLQYFVSRGAWVGSGDILLGAALGAWFGFPLVLGVIFLGYWVGFLVLLPKIFRRKIKRQDRIPLGFFLAIAWFLGMVAHWWRFAYN